MDEKIDSVFSLTDEFHIPIAGTRIEPDQAMALAIRAAFQGAAHVSPNPLVGCVIVDSQHRFVSVGYHQKAGEAHAEINALKKVELPQDATMYVTLEPCAHEGRTPSCAKHIALLSVNKVVYGLLDPNPLVAGKGIQILQAAGKFVEKYQGKHEAELLQVPEIFFKNLIHKKPFVALKVATSLDGHLAHKSGESKWITGESSRLFAHELRSQYDAVLIGKETLLQDDPHLTVRHPKIQKSNQVIVLDRSGEIQKQLAQGKKFKIFEGRGTDQVHILSESNVQSALDRIWQLGIRSVFVEGGSQIFSAFLAEGLADRLHCFIAPVIIGGNSGINWTSSFQIPSIQERISLKHVKHRSFSQDVYMTGKFESS